MLKAIRDTAANIGIYLHTFAHLLFPYQLISEYSKSINKEVNYRHSYFRHKPLCAKKVECAEKTHALDKYSHQGKKFLQKLEIMESWKNYITRRVIISCLHLTL